MTPTITAFENSPDRGRGLARDMPVRWALEEVGQRYEVRLVSFAEMKKAAHRSIQPFGQIPTYEEDGLALFESGAIVLHISRQRPGLLPSEEDARARAITWMFAALATVQPPIVECEAAIIQDGDRSWFNERLPMLKDRIRTRLSDLSDCLSDREWLDGTFSAGDLLMISVLRRPAASDALSEFSNLAAYVARGEGRAAFKRAFDAQHAVFVAASANS